MKINNKKIVVPALAMAMAAALAGSIAGSVAWYQYSTRATSFLNGTTAGTSRSLQLANTLADPEALDNLDDNNWGYNYAPDGKESFAPTAPLFKDGNALGFVSHPVYQHFNSWLESPDANFFSYDLYFQSLDNKEQKREELDLYLVKVQLDADTDVIKNALRVELVPETFNGSEWIKGSSFLLSQNGGKTEMNDYLDLNGNKIMDRNGFAADDSDGSPSKYIANTPVAVTGADDLLNHYLDADCTQPAWSNKVHKEIGDSGEGLFKDAELSEAAPATIEAAGDYYELASHEYHPAADEVIKGFYSDAALQNAVQEYAEADYDEGNPGEGLFTDSALSIPAEIDDQGKLIEDAHLFSHALANGSETFYVRGKDGVTNTFVKNESEYTTKAFSDIVVNDDNPYDFAGKAPEKVLIKTNGHYAVKLTVKVWLEGWQQDGAIDTLLPEGTDTTGYYTDDTFAVEADNFHEVEGHIGDDAEGLFTDNTLSTPAARDANGKLTADDTYYSYGADPAAHYFARGYIWDTASIESHFNLGLRFAVEAEQ